MKLPLHLIAIACILVSPATKAADPVRPRLTLDVMINTDQQSGQLGSMAGTIIIKNTGDEAVTVEHPHNRMAAAFILFNSLGNVVPPEGIAKVNQAIQQITIQPHSEYKHGFDRFEFLSGSALAGYTLEPGETYRIIAVYRPRGDNEAGIASPERTFTAK